jgi:hypothetical protein
MAKLSAGIGQAIVFIGLLQIFQAAGGVEQ